jgi:hypothetical protein
MNTTLVNTPALIDRALDYAVAKAEGRVLRIPTRATNADLEKLQAPFKLYDTVCRSGQWHVVEVIVTFFGVRTDVGATAPSVTVLYADGRERWSSADSFYLTREEAQLEADLENIGGLDGLAPSTDGAQGMEIIEREKITIEYLGWADTKWQSNIEGENYSQGPAPLIAAMRCYVASKLGDTVEIPNELL